MTKILLDGSKLSADVAGGVVNYINNLFKYYQTHESTFHIKSSMLLLNKLADGTSLKDTKISDRSLVKTFFQFTKSILFGLSEDYLLFHSPYMFLPPKHKNRINVLTVLDMINFERPFSIRNKLRESALRLAIKRANFYICISEATKIKLQAHFPKIKDDQIFITYLGVESTFSILSTSQQFKNLVQDSYLLYVGQRGDYKNFNSLIEFMTSSSLDKKFKILCVGGGKFTMEELTLFNRYQLTESIIHVGYANTEDLKFLYQHAVALAYTSLVEGFGLPILEAMACGCPVICGNFSSMKEIAGGHAVLVNDFSVQSLDKAILAVSSLTKKDIEEARIYASSFTWERTALNTLSIYNQLTTSLKKKDKK